MMHKDGDENPVGVGLPAFGHLLVFLGSHFQIHRENRPRGSSSTKFDVQYVGWSLAPVWVAGRKRVSGGVSVDRDEVSAKANGQKSREYGDEADHSDGWLAAIE